MTGIKCSIIVPVFNQWNLVTRLLERLQQQSFPQNCFEVLLIDNGSYQCSPPKNLFVNVMVHECATPGSYAARNSAIERARGEWLVFTDADCLPRADWLKSLMLEACCSKSKPCIVAGRVEVVVSTDSPNIYQIYDMVKGIPQDWYVSRGYAATANLAVPAETMRALNGFDGSRFSGGDAEFCRRAVAAGVSLNYAPNAVVDHPARDTWEALVTKARRVKGGHLRAGSPGQRIIWLLRTFLPPVVAIWRFVGVGAVPLRYRLIASAIHFRVWGIEMREAIRFVYMSQPERR